MFQREHSLLLRIEPESSLGMRPTLPRGGWQFVLFSFQSQLYLSEQVIFCYLYVDILLAFRSNGTHPSFIHFNETFYTHIV